MNPWRSHDEIAELLGAYALHAVEPDEVELVEAHLEGCPRCRAEVAAHREVAALLGNSGGDAPDGLWERIASRLEEAPPPMRLSLSDRPPDRAVVPLAGRHFDHPVIAAIRSPRVQTGRPQQLQAPTHLQLGARGRDRGGPDDVVLRRAGEPRIRDTPRV